MIGKKFLTIFSDASPETQVGFLTFMKNRKSKSDEHVYRIVKSISNAKDERLNKAVHQLTNEYGSPQLRNHFASALTLFFDFAILQTTKENPELRDYILATHAKENSNRQLKSLLATKTRTPQKPNSPIIDKILTYEIQKEFYSEEYDIPYYLRQLDSVNRYANIEKLKVYVEIFKSFDLSALDIPLSYKNDALLLIKEWDEKLLQTQESRFSTTVKFLLTQDLKLLNMLFSEEKNMFKNASQEEASLILRSLFLFSIKRMNRGDKRYEYQIQKIINLRLNKFIKGMSEFELRNYVLFLCRKGQVDKSRELLDKVINEFREDHKSDIINLNLATIHSYKNEHDQAISHLSMVDQSNQANFLMSKFRLIKIYYDIHQYEALNNLISSFRSYLSDNKSMSLQNKENIRTFLKAISALVKLRENKLIKNYKDKLSKFRQAVEEDDVLINRDWFLSELDSLALQSN